jgi:hypothetical protein
MTDSQVEAVKKQWGIMDPLSEEVFDTALDDLFIETQEELQYVLGVAIAHYIHEGQGSGTYERTARSIEAVTNILNTIRKL